MPFPPERIVCLTAETVETIYLLGEERRIVGVTGYAVRPARVRQEKPRVAAFTSAHIPAILALDPDLVLAFSDLQASLVADLIRAGVAVYAFNQRTVRGIVDMIETVASLLNVPRNGAELVRCYREGMESCRVAALSLPRKPRVYFEEWDEPMICGIAWISELIEIAGGIDVFRERARQPSAKDRVVTPEEVLSAKPDILIGSWCGKKFQPKRVLARPGFSEIGLALREIKAPLILQPGPAALTDGLAALAAIVRKWLDANPVLW